MQSLHVQCGRPDPGPCGRAVMGAQKGVVTPSEEGVLEQDLRG